MKKKAQGRDTDREAARPGAPAAGSNLAGHALYLDIDGTVLDIAETPDATEVPDFVVPLLAQLGRKVDGAIAFVSGRPIAAIDTLFRPLKLAAVGVHGGEIRMPDGQLIADQRLSSQLQAVEPLLQRAMQQIPGAALENKQCVIALHYRRAPQRGREVLNAAELVVGSLGSEFALSLGKCVVEIRARHLTKGAGLRQLMEQPPFRGRVPIFAGDDTSDEDAFEVVNRLGGISVRVGEVGPTAARYRLADPQQLRGWLLEMAQS